LTATAVTPVPLALIALVMSARSPEAGVTVVSVPSVFLNVMTGGTVGKRSVVFVNWSVSDTWRFATASTVKSSDVA
jgi:hypothetical protein